MKFLTKYFVLTVFVWSIFSGFSVFAGPNEELITAAEKGDIAVMQTLLAKGADVDVKDNDGVTALMYAAQNGHKHIVELLKKAGAKE
jgi:ankyrin repeat protein